MLLLGGVAGTAEPSSVHAAVHAVANELLARCVEDQVRL
jgi:hypothetical protein